MHLVPSVLPSVRLFALSHTNKSHYQFKVFVCASVISGPMWIIARMRSIGVLIFVDIQTRPLGAVALLAPAPFDIPVSIC